MFLSITICCNEFDIFFIHKLLLKCSGEKKNTFRLSIVYREPTHRISVSLFDGSQRRANGLGYACIYVIIADGNSSSCANITYLSVYYYYYQRMLFPQHRKVAIQFMSIFQRSICTDLLHNYFDLYGFKAICKIP